MWVGGIGNGLPLSLMAMTSVLGSVDAETDALVDRNA